MANIGKYNSIICCIFLERYEQGKTSIVFAREEFLQKAYELGFEPPKNLGDIIYSYTTLQLFEKNNAQGTFSCIISLHTKPYERE